MPNKLHRVKYEELISNQEIISREMINFCDLDWEEDCISFHSTKRAVNTASAVQVRQPMYASSVGLWKKYETELEAFNKNFEKGELNLKIDAGIPTNDPRESGKATKVLEDAGYDGAFTAETSHDPFLPLVSAAMETERIELVTAIAVAFARNPMILANLGYDLQKLSKGRFILGLGSQIRPHISKRFSMPWSSPAARMKEMIEAIRAIWDCWQNESEP